MTDSDGLPWTVLGVGGLLSLCCLSIATIGGAAAVSGAVAGVGLGGDVFEVLVTAVTVAALGLLVRRRS